MDISLIILILTRLQRIHCTVIDYIKKISEDTRLSERYISRIVEILDVMNIIKF